MDMMGGDGVDGWSGGFVLGGCSVDVLKMCNQ